MNTRFLVDFLVPSESLTSGWRRFAPSYKTEANAERAILRAYPGAEIKETENPKRKIAWRDGRRVAMLSMP